MSTPLTIDDFHIAPLPVERPTLEDLDDDELTSKKVWVLWIGIFTLYVIITFHQANISLKSIDTITLDQALILIKGLIIAVGLILIILWVHLRIMLLRKYAQWIKSADLEAYRLREDALNKFNILERNYGFAQSRLFRLKRTMKLVKKHQAGKLHLSFEREYRSLLIGFKNDLNWLLRCLDQDEQYVEAFEERCDNLPRPEAPLWEIKAIKQDFADLIDKIDGEPTFATIIIILKAADKQLDPERILRKLKWKNQR